MQNRRHKMKVAIVYATTTGNTEQLANAAATRTSTRANATIRFIVYILLFNVCQRPYNTSSTFIISYPTRKYNAYA